MKLNYLRWVLSILVVSLVSACQKDNSSRSGDSLMPEISGVSANSASKQQTGGCRLTEIEDAYGTQTFTYNSNGLLETWDLPIFGYFYRLYYDAKGTLTKADQYVGGQFVGTIEFVYDRKGNVIMEILKGTDPADDVYVHYTYNNRGEIIKAGSPEYDYYIVYEYTPQGNVSMWQLYFGGELVVKSEYTFLSHHKNPTTAVPGIDNGFAWTNSAVFRNKWLSTSEKLTYYNNGIATVAYDQDPTNTIVTAGHGNYVTSGIYYDAENNPWPFTYSYENCGNENGGGPAKVHGVSNNGSNSNRSNTGGRLTAFKKLLLKGSGKTMKQKVAEFRKEFK